MSEPATFSSFVSDNSNFLLSTFGMVAMSIAGCLLFILKSRCKTCQCACIKCERDVISEENLNNITLNDIPSV